MSLLRAVNLTKTFAIGSRPVEALRGVSIELPENSFTFVVGPSGSGKSTFMHLAGALERPTSGTIEVAGRDLGALSDDELSDFRREKLGFVFQAFNLIPNLNAVENVLVPFYAKGLAEGMREKAKEMLKRVGLGDRLDHRPRQLSGGEQQRVAIPRALLKDPLLLLADEPTGELDSKTGAEIFALMRSLHREKGASVVVVTHDTRYIEPADRVIRIEDGRIVEEK